ncbi:MAG: thioesterase [Lachnospiraceae bacterium]|nr:thioesterase [Lachnospiraceae bacterium]
MKLFCIPYAGGSSTIYYKWKKCFPEFITIIPMEYKGHGRRLAELMDCSIEEVVDDLCVIVSQYLDGEDYAFYGHSMGSIVAFEMYHKMKKEGFKEPKHIFFSGHAAPECANNGLVKHLLTDEKLINEIVKMGGFSKKIMQEKKLVTTMLPILRNDFKIIETYQYNHNKEKMDCPISILYGIKDMIEVNDLKMWEKYTTNSSSFYGFDGDHFFINEYYPVIAKIINNILGTQQIPKREYKVFGKSNHFFKNFGSI